MTQMTARKDVSFAHFAGESDEQRDAHLAALEAELAGARTYGEDERAKLVEAEIKRIRPAGKQSRAVAS